MRALSKGQSFQMSPLSSNNHDYYFGNKTVLVICENNSGIEFEPTMNFEGPNDSCKSPRIPRSESELVEVIKDSKTAFHKE